MTARLAAVVLALIVITSTTPASADLIFNISEVGGDVLFVGSGSIDLTDATFFANNLTDASIRPDAFFSAGPNAVPTDVYFIPVSGPATFGFGTTRFVATTGSGDLFGLDLFPAIGVPTGYISGDPLSGSSTYSGATLNSLGLTPGTYVWTVGTTNLTTIELNIVGVPEPSSFLLFGISGVCFYTIRRRRRARQLGK